MNETLKTILTRRSTRKFLHKPIPAEDLDLIVQAALHAPSGMGKQTWQFTVVKNQFPLVKDIVGYLKMCHSILPITR